MKLKELDDFLKEINIPEIRTQPKTFLGIARQPHYENVLSNLYAFFFTTDEVHLLNDLFISVFIRLIQSKLKTSKDLNFIGELTAETEVETKKGGRIDLLLQSEDSAIIVENKVYHILYNDLQDYWDSVKSNQKIGVVLSLRSIRQTNHPDFINITHFEFLTEIFKNIGQYLLKAEKKYLLFLEDLYQNIINLNNAMDKKYIEFYYAHNEKINEITKIQNRVKIHICDEIKNACEILDMVLTLSNKKGEGWRYYQSHVNRNLMFTIDFQTLLTTDKILYIIIELKNDVLKQKQKILKQISKKFLEQINMEDESGQGANYFHFVTKEYTLSNDDISNLGNYIVEKIDNDKLKELFLEIEDIVN